jgi:hypothetical protein
MFDHVPEQRERWVRVREMFVQPLFHISERVSRNTLHNCRRRSYQFIYKVK